MREDYGEEDAEDARVEGSDNDDELGLGDDAPGNSGSVIDGPSTPGEEDLATLRYVTSRETENSIPTTQRPYERLR